MPVKEMNESKRFPAQAELREAKLREQLKQDREEVRNAFRIPNEILEMFETATGAAMRTCRK